MNRIRVRSEGHVARVTLARPEKKNALDQQTATELLAALTAAAQDAEIRVILIDADGADFCAGADLQALADMLDAGDEAHWHDAQTLGRLFIAIREIPKPVVAAVRGRAFAGGAGLATACDIIVAHEDARFAYPEVRVGFVPAMVMTMLRRVVGEKIAFDLVSTGRILSAREAERFGLVSRVFPNDTFEDDLVKLLTDISHSSASAISMTKRLFYDLDGLDFRDGIAQGERVNVKARSTPDFREGVLRFVSKGQQ